MDRCRALIVDEDRPFVERVVRSLAAIGFGADTVGSRHAALDSLRQRRPAIVVLALERSEDLSLARELRRSVDDVPFLLLRSDRSAVELPPESELAPATAVARFKCDLDEAAILEELDRVLRLGLDRSELARLATSASPSTARRGDRSDAVADREHDASGVDGASEALPAELTATFARWRSRLDQAEESHRAAIREGASRHRAEIAAVESACRAELDDLRERQATERQRRLDDEIRAVEERQRETLEELRRDHSRILEERTIAKRRELDRELEEATARHREERQAEREAHRLEVDSLRGLRAELEQQQRQSAQQLERLTTALAAARAELESEREGRRQDVAELRELQGSIEDRGRESVEQLERVTAALEDDLTRETGRRVSELEEIETKHRALVAEIEARHREQVELMRRLHQEEIEQLQARSTRDQERQEREHIAALKAVAGEQRETTDRVLEQREGEWRAALERERSEHARILAAERAEFRVVLDALRGTRSDPGAGAPLPPSAPAGEHRSAAEPTLLEVVEQLESSLVPQPSGDSAPGEGDPPPGRSD